MLITRQNYPTDVVKKPEEAKTNLRSSDCSRSSSIKLSTLKCTGAKLVYTITLTNNSRKSNQVYLFEQSEPSDHLHIQSEPWDSFILSKPKIGPRALCFQAFGIFIAKQDRRRAETSKTMAIGPPVFALGQSNKQLGVCDAKQTASFRTKYMR